MELSIAAVWAKWRELFTFRVCFPFVNAPVAICIHLRVRARCKTGIVKMLRARAIIKSVKEIFARTAANATAEQGGIHGTGKVRYDKILRALYRKWRRDTR